MKTFTIKEIEKICNQTKNKAPTTSYGDGWNDALEHFIKKIKEVK